MGFDKVKIKQIVKLILLVAVLILAIIYVKDVVNSAKVLLGILKPFIIGGVIAFILNIPLRVIENKLFKKWNGKFAAKSKRPVSIFLSILFIVLLINVVILSVAPQLVKTIAELGRTIPVFAERVLVDLEALAKEYPQIQEYVVQLESIEIDWNSLVNNLADFMKSGMTDVLSSTFSVASSIIGGFMNFFIGLIFALYILGQKEVLASQGKRIMKAYLQPKANSRMLKVFKLLYDNFSNFITGQCLEAVILGSLFVVTMTIFRLPYALLVGVLIAFTALIPIVGAFIGCFVGAFLMLVDDPKKAVVFLILFLVLQQVEGNLIYPRVVGNKVGLPSIWVLMAVTVGGSLFGIVGMLAFIPLVSTFYALLRENVNERNRKKDAKNHRYTQSKKKKYEQPWHADNTNQ